jgi:DNA-binding FadR family transcriptional regulator
LKFEAQACGLAASRITEDQIATLKQTLQETPNQSEQAHRRFHCLVAEACQNDAVYAVVDWLWDLREQSEICRFFFHKLCSARACLSLDSEGAILEALEARDAAAARTAMHVHLEKLANQAAAYFQSLQPLKIVEA